MRKILISILTIICSISLVYSTNNIHPPDTSLALDANKIYLYDVPVVKYSHADTALQILKQHLGDEINKVTRNFEDPDDADFANSDQFTTIENEDILVYYLHYDNNYKTYLTDIDLKSKNISLKYKNNEIQVGDDYKKIKNIHPTLFKQFEEKNKEKNIYKEEDLYLGFSTYNNERIWFSLAMGISYGKIKWIAFVDD